MKKRYKPSKSRFDQPNDFPFTSNGYPALVSRNTIPGEKPWRMTWFDITNDGQIDLDEGALGHIDLTLSELLKLKGRNGLRRYDVKFYLDENTPRTTSQY